MDKPTDQNMRSIDDLLRALKHAAPEIETLETEHVRTYDELLPHVFFGDLTRWMVANHPQPNAISVMEDFFINGDEPTKNLIAASFVENIEPGADYDALRNALGPRLRKQWDAIYS